MQKLQALKASAGSGKTFALSVRYISLLFLGANASSIVALTFTKKAANEMQQRIFATLANLEEKEELNEICKLTHKTKEQILEQKDFVLNNFLNSSLHVQTIDAFFGQILRKFSLHLAIMPDFITIDKTKQNMLEELFLSTLYKNEKLFNTLASLMINEEQNLTNVFSHFVQLYEKSKEICFEKININTHVTKEQIIQKAYQIRDFLQKKQASNTAITMFNQPSLEKLLTRAFWKDQTLNTRTFKKVYEPYLDEMFFELKGLYKDYCLQKQNYMLNSLFDIFNMYDGVKYELAKQTNELSFSDVAFYTHKLLSQNINNDFLYFRLDGIIEHLLIDEFQDTNVLQFDILAPIVSEIASGIGVKQNKSFFYVGDTKQSIYRFRGGTSELFDEVAKNFNVNVKSLDTNYRSDGIVVRFVNDIFVPLYHDFKPQNVPQSVENDGFVKIKTNDDLLFYMQESIDFLLQSGVECDDIAILCHTNKDAQSIQKSIYEYNNNLQVSIQSTTNITSSYHVKLIIEYLKYSYFQSNIWEKNTLVLLGESFLSNLTCKITNFNQPVHLLVLQAIKDLNIDATDEDVLRFIEICRDFFSIEELLFELEFITQPSVNTQNEGIKVLTIHKSKGLEYKHVIVLDKLSRPSNNKGTFLFEYDKQRLQKMYLRIKNREFVDEEYELAKQKDNKAYENDFINAMYVAFTRAKNSLFVIKKQKSAMDILNLSDVQKGKILPSVQKVRKTSTHIFSLMPHFGLQKSLHVNQVAQFDNEAIYFGLAFHYLMELSFGFSKEALDNAYTALLNKYSEFTDTKAVLQSAYKLVQNEQFLALVSKGIVKKEVPLKYKGEKKQLDLLVELENEYIIIDYKTSNSVQNEHVKQVQTYKKALEFIDNKAVQAWLFYINNDGVSYINVS